MQGKKVLIVGCGKIGGRVAKRLSSDFQVFGLRRRPQMSQDDIHYLAADVREASSLEEVFSQVLTDGVDYLIYCLTPSQRTEQGYRDTYVTGLENTLTMLPNTKRLKRLIFVSSSSVYHQNDDSWIDEQSPCEPKQFSGKLIFEAEGLLRHSGIPSTIIRFSGIYGGSRRQLINQVKQSAESGAAILSKALRRSNRIHEDDCVGFIEHLIRLNAQGSALEPLYLASDNEPVDLNEVIIWLAEHLGLTINTQPSEQAKRRSGNKQCSNRRMLDSAYQLHYPTFREGYQAMLR